MKTLEEALRRAEEKLSEKDYATLKAVVDAYAYLTELVNDKNTSIARLRKMLFGAKTEKTATVIGGNEAVPEAPSSPGLDPPTAFVSQSAAEADAEGSVEGGATGAESDGQTADGQGHGRNGAGAYTSAEKIEVRHQSLQPGDSCPQCDEGTVYETSRPGVLVRLVGQPPVGAKVYYLQKLRCNLCGVVFTADLPAGVDAEEKYDATVGSMIALLKYGYGMPFNRNETLQENLGVPLPASTQWDIVEAQAERAEPVFDELLREAGQGDVLHNDDTGVKILEMMGERARQAALAEETADIPVDKEGSAKKAAEDRTGMFTSGIIATREGHKIALFLSGRQHAGENLKDVLARARRSCRRPFRCAMPCRGIGHPLGPASCRRFLPTVWPTADGSSWTWPSGFPRNVGTCWKRSP